MKSLENGKGRLWPSPAQETLLLAALTQGEAAGAHFRSWLEMVDVDRDLDEGSYKTLPLLWANLSQQGVEHPVLPRFKGVLRSAWVESARRRSCAAEILTCLADAGIPTLVTKGLPLSILYYEKIAYRPMNDIDIVVPTDRAADASRLLEEKGFTAARSSWRNERALRHALMHKHPDASEVDLHWHVLFECPNGLSDRHFWNDAIEMEILGAKTLRPCATDLLLHILVHGVRWNMSPPMRWVADSAMILRSGEGIDWNRLVAFALRHRLGSRLGLGLAYLGERFALPVPGQVIEMLAQKASLVERMELLAMRERDNRGAWRYLRRATYLVRLMGSDDVGRLPLALAGELATRSGLIRRTRIAANERAAAVASHQFG